MRKQYTIFQKERIVGLIALFAVLAVIAIAVGVSCGRSEDALATCWAMCKPGSKVTVRSEPKKDSAERGYLECGDSFQTDAEEEDGWIRCYGIGEGGWVFCGYVATEKPVEVGERYVCVANVRAACRKWIGGPQIDGYEWIKNGQTCQVFVTDGEWAVTNRGYIKMEWLEVDPE